MSDLNSREKKYICLQSAFYCRQILFIFFASIAKKHVPLLSGLVLFSCFITLGLAETLKLERLFFTETERTELDELGAEGLHETNVTLLSRMKASRVNDLSSDPLPKDKTESISSVRFDGFYFEHGVASGINDKSYNKKLPNSRSEEPRRSIKLWINGERWKPAHGDNENSTTFRLTPNDPGKSTEKLPANVQQLTWLSEEKKILVEFGGSNSVYLKPGDEILVKSNGSVQKEN